MNVGVNTPNVPNAVDSLLELKTLLNKIYEQHCDVLKIPLKGNVDEQIVGIRDLINECIDLAQENFNLASRIKSEIGYI